jgi:8-oxo-dGTP diphosphatase
MSKYCPILATLGYIVSPDRKQVLLMHRNKRTDDDHYGKYNGLGGKVAANEDVVSAMRREILEESGLHADDVVLRGTISWPGFGKNGEDWFGFIFRIDSYTGALMTESHEGSLEWIDMEQLPHINMWESDRRWLDMIFEESARTFHGIAPFKNGEMVSWGCSFLN